MYVFSGIVLSILMVYGPLYIKKIGGNSNYHIALLFIIPSFIAFFFNNFWGTLYDYYPKLSWFVIFGYLSNFIAFMLLAYPHDYKFFLGVTVFVFIFGQAQFSAGQAYITLKYPNKKGEYLGKLMGAESFGWFLGCILSYFVFSNTENILVIRFIFKLISLLSLILCVLFAIFFDEDRKKLKGKLDKKVDFFGNLRLFYSNFEFFKFTLFVFMFAGLNMLFFSMFSPYYVNVLGGKKKYLSLATAGATLLGALAFNVLGKISDKYGVKKMIFAGVTVYSLFYFVLCFVKNPIAVMIIYMLPIYPVLKIGSNAFISKNTDKNIRGTGIGAMESVHILASAVFPIISAKLTQTYGLDKLPQISFIGSLVLIVLFLVLFRKREY
jgi:MFS family permease